MTSHFRGDHPYIPHGGATFRIESFGNFHSSSKRNRNTYTYPFYLRGSAFCRTRIKFWFGLDDQLRVSLLVSPNLDAGDAEWPLALFTTGHMLNMATNEFAELWSCRCVFPKQAETGEQEHNVPVCLKTNGRSVLTLTYELIHREGYVKDDEVILKWDVKVDST